MPNSDQPSFKVLQSCAILDLDPNVLTPEIVIKAWKKNILETHSDDERLIALTAAKTVLLDWLTS